MARRRQWPPGTTAAERMAHSRADRLGKGGRRVEAVLSPEAAEAWAQLKTTWGDASDKAMIERLILERERLDGA